MDEAWRREYEWEKAWITLARKRDDDKARWGRGRFTTGSFSYSAKENFLFGETRLGQLLFHRSSNPFQRLSLYLFLPLLDCSFYRLVIA